MYEIAEIFEPYGTYVIKKVKTEKEAKAEVDRLNNRNKSVMASYGYRKI